MFWTMLPDAAAGSAASGADAFMPSVEGPIAAFCVASLLTTAGDEDTGAESSAPQPLSEKVVSATKIAVARRMLLLMFASSFVVADAVSRPFKKKL